MRATDSSRSSRWSRGSSSASDKQSDREVSCADTAERGGCVEPPWAGCTIRVIGARVSRATSSTEEEQDRRPLGRSRRNRGHHLCSDFPIVSRLCRPVVSPLRRFDHRSTSTISPTQSRWSVSLGPLDFIAVPRFSLTCYSWLFVIRDVGSDRIRLSLVRHLDRTGVWRNPRASRSRNTRACGWADLLHKRLGDIEC